ncbi:Hypothetical predicted protein [Podarcis lilfordi]|uniref:Uncharacterized protein n=1 Tax=Podarcis lilfordi TaxID=74358 RepID=A0AA35LNT1_9SAUR|nr:Hypothetical predicted protein [Podarcis lilfordi]
MAAPLPVTAPGNSKASEERGCKRITAAMETSRCGASKVAPPAERNAPESG